MSCPYCGNENYIPEVAVQNVNIYRTSALVATSCCKQPIRIRSTASVIALKTTTNSLTDDWGQEFAKPSLLGKFILVKSDYNLTTGTVHEVVEDDQRNSWIKVKSNSYSFNRDAVLFSGIKEEMEATAKEYQVILDRIELRKQETAAELKEFSAKFLPFNYHSKK